MGYYEDKLEDGLRGRFAAVRANGLVGDVEHLTEQLRRAAKQIDKLDRKLRIRSKRLGEARATAAALLEDLMNAALDVIPAGYDFADNAREREMEFQLQEAEREIDYLRRQERDW